MSLNEVYIVFNSSNEKWWRIFLHKINHCYLLIPDRDRLIVYGKVYKSVDIYTINDYEPIINDIMIKVRIKEINNNLFMLNTCVGIIKQFIGIRDPFLWTPYQLYKRVK